MTEAGFISSERARDASDGAKPGRFGMTCRSATHRTSLVTPVAVPARPARPQNGYREIALMRYALRPYGPRTLEGPSEVDSRRYDKSDTRVVGGRAAKLCLGRRTLSMLARTVFVPVAGGVAGGSPFGRTGRSTQASKYGRFSRLEGSPSGRWRRS